MIDPDLRATLPPAAETFPYFQPVLSLQTQRIIGYEALGRRVSPGIVRSLGPFFQNTSYSEAEHLRIDRIIRSRAIGRMANADSDAKLFINLKPSWIHRIYREKRELPTLQMMRRHGLDPSRIVIEITEEDFTGGLDELSEMIGQYREAGCLIAVDDIGSGYSNYDRIASVKPHILKIDLKLLKKSAVDHGYNAVLNSFSILAAQMGASLLVEGVETKGDLNHALQVGARYVQGYLFSQAEADLQQEDAYEGLLRESIAVFTHSELDRQHRLFAATERLSGLVPSSVEIRSSADADALIGKLLPHVGANVVRIYICKEEGFQVSSNFSREADGSWSRDVRYQESNWIWRPYFIPTVLQMKHQRQGCLSQPYTDLDSSLTMQTYSCPLGGACYLFFDLTI
ncbi:MULTISPECIES: EAL domain-containing protein [Paenibacillus]|uniref:EAL domain-containing protein n=1 Tax=Paenibacillus TaxID=44249 RepID=UPI0019152D03|nr:EAL domain-containing protein [Paenibacillus sp. EPM92]